MNTRSLHALELEELSSNEGLMIGFGGKLYTLWRYSSHYNERGERDRIEFFYCKNLCADRNRVAVQYPGVHIDENLKGETWVVRSNNSSSKPAEPKEKAWDEIEDIPFGKYKGSVSTEVHDCSWWCYMANHTAEDDTWNFTDGSFVHLRPLYEKRAAEEGGVKLGGWWYNPNDDNPWNQTAFQIVKSVSNNEPFSFIAPKNDNSFWFGGISINFKPEDTYEFYTYYGGGRFLVVTDKKGNRKNKRAKGKTITINKYTSRFNEELGRIDSITVDEFTLA